MAYSIWLGALGWGIFSLALVIAIILFLIKRKFYPIMYLISVSTYIFTIGFVIDAFDFNKNMILLTLAASSAVFIFMGYHMSVKFEKHKKDFADSISSKK